MMAHTYRDDAHLEVPRIQVDGKNVDMGKVERRARSLRSTGSSTNPKLPPPHAES